MARADTYTTLLPEYYMRALDHRSSAVVFDCQTFQARDVPACRLFHVISGNSGLTEEYLYSLLLHERQRQYKLLTGSIDVENAPRTHRCQHPKNASKRIAVHSGEAVHVVRKGKAGHVNYLPQGKYTFDDDAYLLVQQPNHGFQLSREWVAKTQAHVFQEYASSSDSGT